MSDLKKKKWLNSTKIITKKKEQGTLGIAVQTRSPLMREVLDAYR